MNCGSRAACARPWHRRHIRSAPASRCGICSTTCRPGAGSCAARAPSSVTSCARSSGWRCRSRRWRSGCATTAARSWICRLPTDPAGVRTAHRSDRSARNFAASALAIDEAAGALRLLGLARVAHRVARAGRSAVLVRECARGARSGARQRGPARLPRRALSWPSPELSAVPAARSAPGRCQRASEQARAALSRQPCGARRGVSRDRARTRGDAAGACGRRACRAGGADARGCRPAIRAGSQRAAGRVARADARRGARVGVSAQQLCRRPGPGGRRAAAGGAAPGDRDRAAARSVHPCAKPRGPDSGRYPRRARARDLRTAEGAVPGRCAGLAAAARAVEYSRP